MRHGGHKQQVPKRDMTCPRCKEDKCNECVDVTRILLGFRDLICTCTRRGHGGEPRDKQIADPFTGDVHAPGLVIKTDGEVVRDGK